MEWKNSSKQNKIGQLTIKNYTFERVENFKYLGVIFNEDNKHQTDLQERIKNAKKHTLCYKNFLEIKIYLKTKIKIEEHTNRQNFNVCIRNLDNNKER